MLGYTVLSQEAASVTIGSVAKYREDVELVAERSLGWLVGADA